MSFKATLLPVLKHNIFSEHTVDDHERRQVTRDQYIIPQPIQYNTMKKT